MDERKRNQQPQADRSQQNDSQADQQGEMQNVSDDQSQEQTQVSGENFYHNRDRGNYDPDRTSEEGGGSLY